MNKTLVVIVEDDHSHIYLMTRIMDNGNREILVAETEESARDKINQSKDYNGPVVFLMDTSLTGSVGKQGIVLTQEILSTLAEFKTRPLILSTSSFEGDEMRDLGITYTSKELKSIEAQVNLYEDTFTENGEETLRG